MVEVRSVEVRCQDGRVLDVVPLPVLDRAGVPYETTLRLLLDGAPFGDVGQRCGGVLAALAARLDAAPVPCGAAEHAVRRWGGDDAWVALRPLLPRDAELLALRSRDPDDATAAGELRALLDVRREWSDDAGAWRTRTAVVLQAWGDDGTGVRGVLDVPAFRGWLAALLEAAGRPTT